MHSVIDLSQSQENCTFFKQQNIQNLIPAQRSVSLSDFLKPLCKGGLTLEAAVSFPLFFMCLLAIMMITNMLVFSIDLQQAMETAAGRIARDAYAADAVLSGVVDEGTAAAQIGESALVFAATEATVKGLISDEIRESGFTDRVVEGGLEGISFLGTGFDSSAQDIVIVASYHLVLPFVPGGTGLIRIIQKAVRHAWIGKTTAPGTEEQIVYVTENGTVYHLSLACTHIKLQISQTALATVGNLRNTSGGKYYACEICGDEAESQVFIAAYGDRYHSDRNCPGLKRTIRSVPISQVGDLPLCKRCAARSGQ